MRVREIDDGEGRRLVPMVRRDSGPALTWRRAQMVLLSAPGMTQAAIAKVWFTSQDRVGDAIGNVSADGFGWLYPRCKGGRPPTFSLPQRRWLRGGRATSPIRACEACWVGRASAFSG